MSDAGKISVTLTVERDLHAWLNEEAARRRSSMAYVIRMLMYDAMEASIKKGERYGKNSGQSQGLHAPSSGDNKF